MDFATCQAQIPTGGNLQLAVGCDGAKHIRRIPTGHRLSHRYQALNSPYY